jgi:hypothetical protein
MAAPNEARPPVATERALQEHTTPSDSASIGAANGLDKFDAPLAVRAAIEQHDKLVATLRARAALHGFQLFVTTGPAGSAELVLVRWGQMRTFTDIAAVERFLATAGGTPQ